MKNKKIYTGIVGLVVLITLVSNISAFAVSSQYWEENPLIVLPGETKDFKIVLQNMAGEEDVIAELEILGDSSIIEILDESNIYSVPVGQRVDVNLRASVPEEQEKGSEFEIILSVRTISQEDAQTLGFGSGIERKIPVLTEEQNKKETSKIIYYIIGSVVLALIIAVIIFFIYRKRQTDKF